MGSVIQTVLPTEDILRYFYPTSKSLTNAFQAFGSHLTPDSLHILYETQQ